MKVGGGGLPGGRECGSNECLLHKSTEGFYYSLGVGEGVGEGVAGSTRGCDPLGPSPDEQGGITEGR